MMVTGQFPVSVVRETWDKEQRHCRAMVRLEMGRESSRARRLSEVREKAGKVRWGPDRGWRRGTFSHR